MAHAVGTLVQAGTALHAITAAGGVTNLTLPTGVTLVSTDPLRTALAAKTVVLVNTPSIPLIVDDGGTVMPLSPAAPTAAPTLTQPNSGSLTGTFGVKYTFIIRTTGGEIIAESEFSPSASITITSKKITVSGLETLSGITFPVADRYEIIRRVYRTSNGTSTYFIWYDVEDNTTTTFEDEATDASLAAFAADVMGTPPALSHIAFFRERLFGVDPDERDRVLHAEAGRPWAWPADNLFETPLYVGDEGHGVTALVPRRDALGVAKANCFLQLTGTDDVNFRMVTLSTSIGVASQESVVVYREAAYFLSTDGVYRWDDGGIKCISDGAVRNWFATDDYFDRTRFDEAFAYVDPERQTYRLFLIPIDDEDEACNTWVEFDLQNQTWWGPHTTNAYVFTAAFQLGGEPPTMALGSDTGEVIVETADREDAGGESITIDARTAPMHIGEPPVTAYWGELVTEVNPQDAGYLEVIPTVGEIDAAASPALVHDLMEATQRIGRLGVGRFVQLQFTHDTWNEILELSGFEINPTHTVGRR